MKQAVAYIRVSTSRQAEKGASIEVQRQACRDWAVKNGFVIVKEFIDRGESAKTADRTELLNMITYCRKNKGKISCVVVYKVDRFARQAGDHLQLRAIFAGVGVRLESVTEPLEDSAAGHLIETMLSGVAQFDNEIRADRSKASMARFFSEGCWFWKVPVGFEKYNDEAGHPRVRQSNQGVAMRKVFEHFLSTACTQVELIKYAYKLGITRPNGKSLLIQTMNKMLRNPMYAGVLRCALGDDVRVPIGIITLEEHTHVLNMLEGKNGPYKPRTVSNPQYPLKKSLLHADCGRYLRGSAPRGRSKTYPLYHCTYCKASSVPVEVIHDQFVALLKELKPSGPALKIMYGTIRNAIDERSEVAKQALKKVEQEIEKLATRRDKVYDLYLDGKLTIEEKTEQVTKLDERLDELRLQADDLRNESLLTESQIQYAINFLDQLDKVWVDASYDQKIRFQLALFPRGINYDFKAGFGTAKSPLMLGKYMDKNESKSTMVALRGIEPRLPE